MLVFFIMVVYCQDSLLIKFCLARSFPVDQFKHMKFETQVTYGIQCSS